MGILYGKRRSTEDAFQYLMGLPENDGGANAGDGQEQGQHGIVGILPDPDPGEEASGDACHDDVVLSWEEDAGQVFPNTAQQVMAVQQNCRGNQIQSDKIADQGGADQNPQHPRDLLHRCGFHGNLLLLPVWYHDDY